MAVTFKSLTKHGRHQFPSTVAVSFADDRAEEYFVAAGLADETTDEAAIEYPAGTVEIDPETVFGTGDNAGMKVLA